MANEPRDIAFTRYEGRRGLTWLAESYRMFSRHRLPWMLMLFAYYLALWLVDRLPLVGVIVAPLIKPALSVGFLAAAWTQERGGKPSVRLLLQGFRANLGALLPLGVVFVLGVSLALGATALIDGGRLLEMLYGAAPAADDDPTGAARNVQETLASPRVHRPSATAEPTGPPPELTSPEMRARGVPLRRWCRNSSCLSPRRPTRRGTGSAGR